MKIIEARTQVTDELAPRITESQGVSDMECGLSDLPRNESNKDLPPEEPLRIAGGASALGEVLQSDFRAHLE